jgi:hypothetical protein
MQFGFDKVTVNKFQIGGYRSGWTEIAGHLFLTSTKFFQSASARVDIILIPSLHKGLFVVCNT